MSQEPSAPDDLEARLAKIQARTLAKLPQRAANLEQALAVWRHQNDAEGLTMLTREVHKIRGISPRDSELHRHAGALEEELHTEVQPGVEDRVRELARLARAAAPSDAPQAQGKQAAPQTDASQARILAVDDDDAIGRMVELTLVRLGKYNATLADSGKRAIELLDDGRFDLILLDAMMPDLNGRELCQRIRSHPLQHDTRVVIMSAASADELGWSWQSAGPDAWWRKPLTPKAILNRVNELLGQAPQR